MPAPTPRRPMLPLQLCVPDTRRLLSDPAAWAWQVKWDGFRTQVHTASGAVYSRQGNRLDPAFPDVVGAIAAALPAADHVLDCELVVLGADGRPDFDALCRRAAAGHGLAPRRARSTPASLIVFDALVIGGQDMRALPWQDRRAGLDALGLPQHVRPGSPSLACPPVEHDGHALLLGTLRLRLEGVVAVRRDAPYAPGRSGAWVKVKHAHARDLQPGRRWRPHRLKGAAAAVHRHVQGPC